MFKDYFKFDTSKEAITAYLVLVIGLMVTRYTEYTIHFIIFTFVSALIIDIFFKKHFESDESRLNFTSAVGLVFYAMCFYLVINHSESKYYIPMALILFLASLAIRFRGVVKYSNREFLESSLYYTYRYASPLMIFIGYAMLILGTYVAIRDKDFSEVFLFGGFVVVGLGLGYYWKYKAKKMEPN